MIQFKRRLFPEKNRYNWLKWLRWLWVIMLFGLAVILYLFFRMTQKF
ncbi:MAG: hypothetical protein OEZ20_00405 [candidate division WOR-3 bacterium]|nr:hypothetical protein [candidate division WOR-3 bacterium]